MDWSFSTERCFRRCQRQFFFREILAWHNGRDPLRREAFILKQLKSLETWRGSVVHQVIQQVVVPCFQERTPLDWDSIIKQALRIAARQYSFSEARKYRDLQISKSKIGDEYCALAKHESGEGVTATELERTLAEIETAFRNLARMKDFLKYVHNRPKYWAELPVSVEYSGARINGQIDLMFFRGYGQPTIIDWKCYEGTGGSDAHLQTALYGWLLCRNPKWNIPSAEEVELIEVRLSRNPSIIRHRFDSARFSELEDRVFRSVEEMRELCGDGLYADQEIAEYAYATNPNSCAFCAFRKLCQETETWPSTSLRSSKSEMQPTLI